MWAALSVLIAGCSAPAMMVDGIRVPMGYDFHGKTEVKPAKAITVAQAFTRAEQGKANYVTVKGVVETVCQTKGCWMTLKTDRGQPVRVTFKDYAFFMPKDIAGRAIVASGVFESKIQSVEEQKHLLEDEGKPQAEIDAITSPKTVWSFVADGVLIRK